MCFNKYLKYKKSSGNVFSIRLFGISGDQCTSYNVQLSDIRIADEYGNVNRQCSSPSVNINISNSGMEKTYIYGGKNVTKFMKDGQIYINTQDGIYKTNGVKTELNRE